MKADEGPGETSQIITQRNAASAAGCPYKIFTDKELLPHVATPLRWLKAINYAACLRDRDYTNQRLALLSQLRFQKEGILDSLLSNLTDYERPIIVGLLVRLAIQGYVPPM